MINLILDCSYGMNVYLVSDSEVYSFEDKTQNKHSDEILKVIDELLLKAKEKFEFPVKWGIDLQSEHERYLTEKVSQKPVFLKKLSKRY